MRADAPDGPDRANWFDQDDLFGQDSPSDQDNQDDQDNEANRDDRNDWVDRFDQDDPFDRFDQDDPVDRDDRYNGDDRNNWADRPGPKLGPGPVTDKFGRVGLYRRVSITPPSNWRKASWLIVATASVVLVVLVHGAVRLAGPNGRSGQIDAFPGLPTGGLLTPQPPQTSTIAMPHPSQDADQRTSTPPTQPGTGVPTSEEAPAGGQPGTQPPTPGGRTPGAGPPPWTGGATSSSSQDEEVGDVAGATGQFFDLLPENIGAAWLMMNPEDQQMDFEEFNRVWRRYDHVEMVHTTIGPDPTTVVATVVVTDHKGVSSTQYWKLTYQRGGQPLINELVRLEPSGTATSRSVDPP
jgi:hypothetical protein